MDQAIGYIRASKHEQSLTPAVQRKAIEQWCAKQNLDLVGVFEDITNGATPIDKRPGLMRALDNLTNIKYLVVAKRDRLARDILIAAMIEHLVERTGAHVVSTEGIANGHSPEAKLLRGIIDVFAQYERALISSRTKSALAIKKSRRERTGQVPWGWKLKHDGIHIEPSVTERDIIRTAKRLKKQGLSLRKIGAELSKLDMHPRSGADTWHPKTIQTLLNTDTRIK